MLLRGCCSIVLKLIVLCGLLLFVVRVYGCCHACCRLLCRRLLVVVCCLLVYNGSGLLPGVVMRCLLCDVAV